MFSKGTVNPEKVDTIIGQHAIFEGTIRGKGCLRLEGLVTGTIDYQGDVVVGETARVNADISGRNVTIAGMIKGNVKATGKLELIKTGRLLGNAEHGHLIVSHGSYFLGESRPAGETPGNKGHKAQPSQKNKEQGGTLAPSFKGEDEPNAAWSGPAYAPASPGQPGGRGRPGEAGVARFGATGPQGCPGV